MVYFSAVMVSQVMLMIRFCSAPKNLKATLE